MASMNERYALDQSNGFDTRLVEQFRELLLVERACVESRLIEAGMAISRQHSDLPDDDEARLDLDRCRRTGCGRPTCLVDISEALGRLPRLGARTISYTSRNASTKRLAAIAT